ncbi:MAG: response regulator [Rubrivivax sp.]|jgi:DNA-binding response OmpR family regulator|nr:response regulator [Rubrivivax sp.]
MISALPVSTVAEPRPSRHGRILVVDDDRLVLATVAHGLAQAGYDVIEADNGDDAILLAREHRPELALLDIRMEGLSGFDVAETLRDVYRIPYLFLSAFADASTAAKVRELRALDYLVKPLNAEQIVPRVDAAFALLRSGAAAGPEPQLGPAAAAAPMFPAAIADPVPLAIGVLMHRYSLSRQAAYERLQRLATEQKLDIASQADRLLAAMEELARPA